MLFTVYNLAEEDFYIGRIKQQGFSSDIDSLEYMSLSPCEYTNEELLNFKNYIEQELQKGKVVIGILFLKNKKKGLIPIIVKPKSVSVKNLLEKSHCQY